MPGAQHFVALRCGACGELLLGEAPRVLGTDARVDAHPKTAHQLMDLLAVSAEPFALVLLSREEAGSWPRPLGCGHLPPPGQERHDTTSAGLFLLGVWNADTDWGELAQELGHGLRAGARFNLLSALASWDEPHRSAAVAWVDAPFWP